jgi:hypothetical protein
MTFRKSSFERLIESHSWGCFRTQVPLTRGGLAPDGRVIATNLISQFFDHDCRIFLR